MILVAHLGLSYACNMRCKHCFVRHKKEDYVIQHYKEIIDKLNDIGVISLYYTYGESLLCPQFYEVASYCHNLKISQILMSNGYFIDSLEDVNKIKMSGINQVFVSLDSISEQAHDKNRGKQGAFEHALQAIKLLRLGQVTTGIANSISSDNVEEMNDMYKLGCELGVKYISYLRIRNQGGLVKFPEELQKKYEDNIKSLIIEAKQNYTQIKFHDPTLKKIINTMISDRIIDGLEKDKYCSMLECSMQHSISIAPNGDFSRCSLSDCVIGNLKTNTLDEMDDRINNYACVKTYRSI